MKITQRKLRNLIRESFFKNLFKKKTREKTEVPEDIADDFGGGSKIDLSDDFERNPESKSGMSRRDLFKVAGAGLAAGAVAKGISVDATYDSASSRGSSELSPFSDEMMYIVTALLSSNERDIKAGIRIGQNIIEDYNGRDLSLVKFIGKFNQSDLSGEYYGTGEGSVYIVEVLPNLYAAIDEAYKAQYGKNYFGALRGLFPNEEFMQSMKHNEGGIIKFRLGFQVFDF